MTFNPQKDSFSASLTIKKQVISEKESVRSDEDKLKKLGNLGGHLSMLARTFDFSVFSNAN